MGDLRWGYCRLLQGLLFDEAVRFSDATKILSRRRWELTDSNFEGFEGIYQHLSQASLGRREQIKMEQMEGNGKGEIQSE